jgi:heat shock protein HtpX
MKRKSSPIDLGLQARMLFTMLLLTAIYLVFAFILFRVTNAGILLFVVPLAGLFFQYYFSDKLVLASAGARIIQPSQAPELYGTVQRLAQQADLPMPRVAIVDTPMPNAFATGRGPRHAVVAVTSGLLRAVTQPELEGVLAHEMTHIRNRDMVIMTMAGSFAAVASWIVQWGFWFGGAFGGGNRRDNNNNAFIVVFLASIVVAILSHLLVMALSRYREYAADRGGALLTGQPEQLQSALLRISGAMSGIPNQDLREAQPLSALFITAPRKGSVIELFSDHPSLEHRLARLQALERQMVTR